MSLNDVEARRIAALEVRIKQMERLMQQLLYTLMSSNSQVDQIRRMETMLQELRGSSDNSRAAASPLSAAQQERPEMAAIRQALQTGNKLKAIQLYRSAFNAGLKEAQDAIDAM
jgi:ribosomal protein L7/L12